MLKILIFDDSDRQRVQKSLSQAKQMLGLSLGAAITLPLFVGALLFITPITFDTQAVVLTFGLVGVCELPFTFLLFDLYRKLKRAKSWLDKGEKCQVKGIISKKDHSTVTVESTEIKYWKNSSKLSVGDEITVEYLALPLNIENPIGVLQINGEQNPYFENAWKISSQTS
jgi:hypothetical protein